MKVSLLEIKIIWHAPSVECAVPVYRLTASKGLRHLLNALIQYNYHNLRWWKFYHLKILPQEVPIVQVCQHILYHQHYIVSLYFCFFVPNVKLTIIIPQSKCLICTRHGSKLSQVLLGMVLNMVFNTVLNTVLNMVLNMLLNMVLNIVQVRIVVVFRLNKTLASVCILPVFSRLVLDFILRSSFIRVNVSNFNKISEYSSSEMGHLIMLLKWDYW